MTGPAEPIDWVAANQRYLSAALEVVRQWLTGGPADAATRRRDEAGLAMPQPPALDAIGDAFGLSAFERDTLLICAGVELDTAVAQACAVAHGDPVRTYATFGLAMAKLPSAHWSAASPAAALRRWHLVDVAHPEAPMTSALRVDERVLHALTGIGYLDPRIEPLVEQMPARRAVPPALRDAADRLAAQWSSPSRSAAQLYGRQRSDLRAAAAAACEAIGLQPVCLRAGDLPATPVERDLLARICERETVLDGRAWLLDVDETAPDGARLAIDMAGRISAPVVVIAREPVPGAPARLAQIAVPPPRLGDVRTLWRDSLGTSAARLDGWLDRVAGQFDLELAGIDAAMAEIEPVLDDDDAGPRLWDACRRQARPPLDDLTQRIEPRAGWDDLVLPARQSRVLREVAVHVRHRLTVLHDWGFAARTGRGLGVAAMFAGPSGTGKTLAAEVLAGELALDLYRIDLSQVVSKYIGETEKNLRRIFDAAEAGGVVLLFDEADALFGKRSEVKDSHDRYANIEVSYLLQRMESYRGLAILTTNLKTALDTAFLRRLRFVVQFPFPDAAGRTEIWRKVFPAQTPTDGLDPVKLAGLTVAGGTIHNIALAAAFLAAAVDEPVRMSHVLQATRTEYVKLEKPLTDAEIAGWVAET
ncbi:MAG TPA: AAA family ATPase [Micromonosporaceae bacterium]|nr:AAA family ATPase [Micromonosporaceae bacterium]